MKMTQVRNLVLASVLTTGSIAMAQNGTPSSKATAAISTAVGCTVSGTSNIADTVPLTCHDVFSGASVDVTPDNFATIMTSTVKVSNSESLFVSPSLVTGLYTNTKTKTSTGSTSTAVAMGSVYLRAVLEDSAGNIVQYADPVDDCSTQILGCQQDNSGAFGVILDSRVQTLSQTLSNCVATIGTGTGTCSFNSTVQLILQTTSAHSFNFIFDNVGVGTYILAIQVGVSANGAIPTGSGTAIGAAVFGLGSVTAEVVRLVHGFSF